MPIAEFMCSESMLVTHTPAQNAALDSMVRDYGLKPNNLTIEEMRENIDFYRPMDDLDRPSVAVKMSASLKDDLTKAVNTLRSVTSDRNKPFK